MARAKKRPTTRRRRKTVRTLGPRSQLARALALDALGMMRSKRQTLAQAAKEVGTTPRTVIKYTRPALSKTSSGRYRAKPSDRLLRQLYFLTADGPIVLDVRDSRKASLVARYSSAVDRYLKTGRAETLTEFQGKSVMVGKVRYPFLTDLRTLERLAQAGEVSYEDLYSVTS